MTAGNRAEQIEQGKIGVKSAEEAVFAAEVTYDYNKTQYDHATALFESGVLSQKDLDAASCKKTWPKASEWGKAAASERKRAIGPAAKRLDRPGHRRGPGKFLIAQRLRWSF